MLVPGYCTCHQWQCGLARTPVPAVSISIARFFWLQSAVTMSTPAYMAWLDRKLVERSIQVRPGPQPQAGSQHYCSSWPCGQKQLLFAIYLSCLQAHH